MRGVLVAVLAVAAFARQAEVPSAREAFDLGRTHDTALFEAFNRGYELAVSGTVDHAEVITEFRRAVLFVHEQAIQGQYLITDRDLAKAMSPLDGLVTFVVEARLHPLNTYAKPPPYELYIETGPTTKPLVAQPLKRDAVYPPGLIGPGNSMTGVRLDATFPRADIMSAPSPSLIVIDDQANVIWKARIDLARYR
ncbi:MAG TPA: hypothetical protein VGI12_18695 [Vicinamibacterales bacterium]